MFRKIKRFFQRVTENEQYSAGTAEINPLDSGLRPHFRPLIESATKNDVRPHVSNTKERIAASIHPHSTVLSHLLFEFHRPFSTFKNRERYRSRTSRFWPKCHLSIMVSIARSRDDSMKRNVVLPGLLWFMFRMGTVVLWMGLSVNKLVWNLWRRN